MKKKVWLATAVAVTLTVGLSARALTGDVDTEISLESSNVAAEEITYGPVELPGITVIVETPPQAAPAPKRTTFGPVNLPGITVFATSSEQSKPAPLALASAPVSEDSFGLVELPGITVVAQSNPNRYTSAMPRPASASRPHSRDGKLERPAMHLRRLRWFEGRENVRPEWRRDGVLESPV